jgi:ElaB/YqjD/DUF883 family membrane-anchored ribosome-binding protein
MKACIIVLLGAVSLTLGLPMPNSSQSMKKIQGDSELTRRTLGDDLGHDLGDVVDNLGDVVDDAGRVISDVGHHLRRRTLGDDLGHDLGDAVDHVGDVVDDAGRAISDVGHHLRRRSKSTLNLFQDTWIWTPKKDFYDF